MTMTMIGYGQYEYTVKNSPVTVIWPILGIALQKNYLSFYNHANGDGPPFACAYAGKLGRARVSVKGVVTLPISTTSTFRHSPRWCKPSRRAWNQASS
jgi:hypothetical protein